MINSGFEIERKFLIAYPEKETLNVCVSASEIVQTYLKNSDAGVSERIRKRVYNDRIEYTHTLKRHVTHVIREEHECVISESEYNELLERADKKRNVIEKRRYCLEYSGQLFEIDVFPFWTDRAFMEIEMDSETQTVNIPPFIRVIKEVTEDKRYTNAALSKSVPFEEI